MKIVGKNEKEFIDLMTNKNPLTNCWEWSQLDSNGYAHGPTYHWIKINKCSNPAQLSYFIYKNVYNRQTHLLIRECQNKACINPEHLKLVKKENKGQILRDIENSTFYIPKNIIQFVLNANETGQYTMTDICSLTNLHRSTILRIIGNNKINLRGSKLSNMDVKKIIDMRNKGEKLQSIATLFNIDKSTVSYITRKHRRK